MNLLLDGPNTWTCYLMIQVHWSSFLTEKRQYLVLLWFFFYSILEFLPLKWTLSCFFQTCFTFLLPCCISNLCWHFVFMCCTIYQEFSIFVWLLYGNRVAIVLTISHHFLIIKLLWNPTQFKYFRENYMSDRSVSIHGAIFPVLTWGIIRRTV